jgi:hypothetical protein
MQKGQWASTSAMAHYLHDDDEAKQDAQIKRIKRRVKTCQADGQTVNICQNETANLVRMKPGDCDKPLKILERVKGIEPSYSAWKGFGSSMSSRAIRTN